jgi:hypothetical protein
LSEASQSSQFVARKRVSTAGVIDGVFVDEDELLEGDD